MKKEEENEKIEVLRFNYRKKGKIKNEMSACA
jgi:hypothetical protein